MRSPCEKNAHIGCNKPFSIGCMSSDQNQYQIGYLQSGAVGHAAASSARNTCQ